MDHSQVIRETGEARYRVAWKKGAPGCEIVEEYWNTYHEEWVEWSSTYINRKNLIRAAIVLMEHQSSPNQIEYPSDGRDIEAKADELEQRERFMHGVQSADHVQETLSEHGRGTQFGWGVVFILHSLGIEMDVKAQDLVLQNCKQLYECLTTESQ